MNKALIESLSKIELAQFNSIMSFLFWAKVKGMTSLPLNDIMTPILESYFNECQHTQILEEIRVKINNESNCHICAGTIFHTDNEESTTTCINCGTAYDI